MRIVVTLTTSIVTSKSLTYECLSFRRRLDTIGLLAVPVRLDAVAAGHARESSTTTTAAIAATAAATTTNTGDTSIIWVITEQWRLSGRSAMSVQADEDSNRSSNGDGEQARVNQPSEGSGHGESSRKKRTERKTETPRLNDLCTLPRKVASVLIWEA